MGVKGLTSYVDCNPDVLETIYLHDTELVIDGNNFFHFLHNRHNLNVKHGGNYAEYAAITADFINTLNRCQIRPFFVFDGVQNKDGSKFQTQLSRAKQRIGSIRSILDNGHGRILPLLIYDTFCEVLRELNIDFVVCDDEADAQTAAIANFKHCPVLTNDSDFFVFNIVHGVILMDYLDFNLNIHEDSGASIPCLRCEKYSTCRILANHPSLDSSAMAFVGTLLGNDFVETSEFENFYSQCRVVNKHESRKAVQNKRNCRIQSILRWLEKQQSQEAAIATILNTVTKDKRKRLRKLLTFSLDYYMNLPSVEDIQCYVNLKEESALCKTNWISEEGNVLPNWLVSSVRHAELPPLLLNSFVNRRLILAPQVECINESSSYNCSSKIRDAIFSLLLQQDLVSNDTVNIDLYDREGRYLKKKSVRLLKSGYLSSYCLTDTVKISCEKQDILHEILGIRPSHFNNLSKNYQLIFMIVVYWIQHASSKLNLSIICSYLLFFLKNNIIDKALASTDCQDDKGEDLLNQKCNNPLSLDYNNVLNFCSRSTLNEIGENITNCGKKRVANERSTDKYIIHSFSQFQTSLYFTKCLNVILQRPMSMLPTKDSFHGSHLYRLAIELSSRSDPLGYLRILVGKENILRSWFDAAIKLLIDESDPINLSKDIASEGFPRKKKKMKKSTHDSIKMINLVTNDDEDTTDDSDDNTFVYQCHANNFAVLALIE